MNYLVKISMHSYNMERNFQFWFPLNSFAILSTIIYRSVLYSMLLDDSLASAVIVTSNYLRLPQAPWSGFCLC